MGFTALLCSTAVIWTRFDFVSLQCISKDNNFLCCYTTAQCVCNHYLFAYVKSNGLMHTTLVELFNYPSSPDPYIPMILPAAFRDHIGLHLFGSFHVMIG